MKMYTRLNSILLIIITILLSPLSRADATVWLPYCEAKKCGYVSSDWKKMISLQYSGTSGFTEGLGRVYLDGKYGFVDTLGRRAILISYDYAERFEDGSAIVSIYKKYGVINKKGMMLLKPEYSRLSRLKNGMFLYKINGKYGLMSKKLKQITKPIFDDMSGFSEGLVAVKQNKLLGVIDVTGKIIVTPQYKRINIYSEQRAAAANKEGKYGYLDNDGKLVIPHKYDDARRFSEGLARVEIGSKWGYIDKEGKLVVPAQYDSATEFASGLARVRIGERFQFIDSSGKVKISLKEGERASPFMHGLSMVGKAGKSGVMNPAGEMVLEPEYKMVFPSDNNKFLVNKNGKWGMVDQNNQPIIPIIIDKIQHGVQAPKGYTPVMINGKFCYVTPELKIIGDKAVTPKVVIGDKNIVSEKVRWQQVRAAYCAQLTFNEIKTTLSKNKNADVSKLEPAFKFWDGELKRMTQQNKDVQNKRIGEARALYKIKLAEQAKKSKDKKENQKTLTEIVVMEEILKCDLDYMDHKANILRKRIAEQESIKKKAEETIKQSDAILKRKMGELE